MVIDDIPEIKKDCGFSIIETAISLNYGFATLRGASQLVKECEKYPRAVFICRHDYPEREDEQDKNLVQFNCKSIMNIIMIAAEDGTRVQIKVEGEDDKSERLALRLYSALTCGDSVHLDFDRFERCLIRSD